MKAQIAALAAFILLSPSPTRAQQAVGGEVVVTAQKPPTQTLLDRKVYDVSRDLQTSTGTAADVLNNVPSVNVDADGNVSIRGDPNVTILVDGKPSAAFTGASAGPSLLQLPANEIDRVEVLTSPPAQFKASGSAGVINIITKKTRKPGLSGAVRANLGDQGRYVLGLDGAYNTKRLRLSVSGGLRHDIRRRLTTTSRVAADPSDGLLVQSAEAIDEHFHRLTPSVKAQIDYDTSARQTLGVTFNESVLTGHRYFDQQDRIGPPAAPSSVSNRHSDGHEWHLEGGEGAHLDQKLWRPGETLTLALNRSITQEHERYEYANTFPLPAAPATYDDLHLGMELEQIEVSADYDLPLAHNRDLRLGYDLEADDNAFANVGHNVDPVSGALIVNPSVTSDFRYRQHVNAAYAQYEAEFGAFTAQAGLRLEAASASWLLITSDIPGARTDFGLYPSLHLDRSLGANGKISLSVSRRINRPDPEALNPFTDYQDTHNLRAGNPNLKPQETWLYELGTSWTPHGLSYSATVYYRVDQNSVTDVLQPVAADVVLATKANLPISRAAGLEFGANGKLGRKISYGLSGNYVYDQIDASALGFSGLRSTTGLNLKATLDYLPTAKDDFQISVSRTDKRLTPQGFVSALNLVNIGYRRQVRADLAIIGTVSDLFNGQRFIRVTDTAVLAQTYQRYQVGRIAYVGLIYTFGATPKKSGAFEYDP